MGAVPLDYNANAQIAFVQPDPFTGSMARAQAYIPSRDQQDDVIQRALGVADVLTYTGSTRVSRPLNGFTAKPNCFAEARVIDSKGNVVKVLNQIGNRSSDLMDSDGVVRAESLSPREVQNGTQDTRWTDWFLSGVSESRSEKAQVVETFGDTYLYVFGQRPVFLTFSGLLLNTADYPWRAEFWDNWDKHFRATALLAKDARMYIQYDDILVEGYPLNAQSDLSANDNNQANFSFSFFVTNYTNLAVANGFSEATKTRLVAARSGYGHTRIDGTSGVVGNSLVDDRLRLARMFGSGGASYFAGQMAENLIAPTLAANLAGATTYAITQALLRSAYDPRGAGNAGQAIANAVSGRNKTNAQILRTAAYRDLEETYNLYPGEINNLLGLAARVADKLVDALPAQSSTQTTSIARSIMSTLGAVPGPTGEGRVSRPGGMAVV